MGDNWKYRTCLIWNSLLTTVAANRFEIDFASVDDIKSKKNINVKFILNKDAWILNLNLTYQIVKFHLYIISNTMEFYVLVVTLTFVFEYEMMVSRVPIDDCWKRGKQNSHQISCDGIELILYKIISFKDHPARVTRVKFCYDRHPPTDFWVDLGWKLRLIKTI